MAGYHSPQVEVAVRLNTNECPEQPPPSFFEELARAARDLSANRYPDRAATALRHALAAHHDLDPEQVFCANGSNEVLQCLMLAYGGSGRRAVVCEPTYALHSHIARLTGTAVVQGGRDERFSAVPEEIVTLVAGDDTAVVLLCSPNNPTGNAEPRQRVDDVLSSVGGLVVVDEAYAQFSPWTAVELLGSSPNLAVTRTFSKTWALAGLRLGYVLADPEVVEACERVALPYHLDAFKQAAGIAALVHVGAMQERVARLLEERGRLEAGLRALPVDVWPSDANFVLFRPRHLDGQAVWRGLLERSVLVRDVGGYPRLDGCLRVTVGTYEETSRFLEALEETLAH